jgi:hypothetical protein
MTFYYKCKNRTFTIQENDLNIIKMFKKLYEKNDRIYNNNNNACTLLETYDLNIAILIDKYVSIWSDKPHDYIDDNIINTGRPEIILHENDIGLIQEYIDSHIQNNPEFSALNKLHQKKFIIKTIYNIIEVCSKLECTSLLKKLYLFIADIIWNCSIIDIEIFEHEQSN